MTSENVLIDQIMKNVMRRLESSSGSASGSSSSSPHSNGTVTSKEKVITRDLLEEIWKEGSQLSIGETSLITPSARDFLREKAIEVVRGSSSVSRSEQSAWSLVLHEPFMHLLHRWNDLDLEVATAMCFEESLRAFQKSLTQNETGAVFIVENPEVVVCKANREKTVRACHIADTSRLEIVWKQLKPNLICLSPESFSNFELKSLIRKIVALDSSSTGRVVQ